MDLGAVNRRSSPSVRSGAAWRSSIILLARNDAADPIAQHPDRECCRDRTTAPHCVTEKSPTNQQPRSLPVAPATPRYFFKVRRSASRKGIPNQRLTRTALKARSAEVWRQTGREREFRVLMGSTQCGGFRGEARGYWRFQRGKIQRRMLVAERDWRSERNCQLTLSEFVAIILLDREALKHNRHIDSSSEK